VKIILRYFTEKIKITALAQVKQQPITVINMSRFFNMSDATAPFVIPIEEFNNLKWKEVGTWTGTLFVLSLSPSAQPQP